MADKWEYTLSLLPPGAPDVTARELVVASSASADPATYPVDPTATEGTVILDEGADVTITCVDVDNAGNRSAPSPALSFTVTDDIPPPAPGEMSVISRREVFEA